MTSTSQVIPGEPELRAPQTDPREGASVSCILIQGGSKRKLSWDAENKGPGRKVSLLQKSFPSQGSRAGSPGRKCWLGGERNAVKGSRKRGNTRTSCWRGSPPRQAGAWRGLDHPAPGACFSHLYLKVESGQDGTPEEPPGSGVLRSTRPLLSPPVTAA